MDRCVSCSLFQSFLKTKFLNGGVLLQYFQSLNDLLPLFYGSIFVFHPRKEPVGSVSDVTFVDVVGDVIRFYPKNYPHGRGVVVRRYFPGNRQVNLVSVALLDNKTS